MKTIKNNVISKYEINKSIFITKLIKIDNKNDVKKHLDIVKNEYKDATHYCYGYIIENEQKASDDKEPSGTAGTPILDVLNKNNLNFILCIVIRYFGGIKLGSGGLIRAYSTSVSNALKISTFVKLIDGYIIEINTDYSNQKNIEKIINKCSYKKEFLQTVKYKIDCSKEILETLNDNNIKYKIINKKKIEI